jgi:hypothetical protein
MSTDQELAAVPAAAADRPETGRDAITIGQDHGSGVEHFQLICPRSSEVWDTPANAGFDRAAIIARLDALRAGGNDYELTDGAALSKHERSALYGQACSALARAGNRYSIRQVFGSRRHGGGDHLGFGVPSVGQLDHPFRAEQRAPAGQCPPGPGLRHRDHQRRHEEP